MSGVKHTPWEVEDFGWPDYLDGIRSRYAVRRKSGAPIAYAFDADEARLIAAAPDLLEALIAARDAANALEISSAHFPRAAVEAAIARARGEQDGGAS